MSTVANSVTSISEQKKQRDITLTSQDPQDPKNQQDPQNPQGSTTQSLLTRFQAGAQKLHAFNKRSNFDTQLSLMQKSVRSSKNSAIYECMWYDMPKPDFWKMILPIFDSAHNFRKSLNLLQEKASDFEKTFLLQLLAERKKTFSKE